MRARTPYPALLTAADRGPLQVLQLAEGGSPRNASAPHTQTGCPGQTWNNKANNNCLRMIFLTKISFKKKKMVNCSLCQQNPTRFSLSVYLFMCMFVTKLTQNIFRFHIQILIKFGKEVQRNSGSRLAFNLIIIHSYLILVAIHIRIRVLDPERPFFQKDN